MRCASGLGNGHSCPVEPEPAVEQPTELRPRLAPAASTPRGTVLDPTGERDLAIRCSRIDADVIVTRRGHRFSDNVSGSIILIEDSDIPDASARFGGERRWDNLGHGVRYLPLKAIITRDEGYHRLTRGIARAVTASFAKYHLRGADYARR